MRNCEEENMADMARTRKNPKAIILGTFHGYKERAFVGFYKFTSKADGPL
jgi:hypothetical protein